MRLSSARLPIQNLFLAVLCLSTLQTSSAAQGRPNIEWMRGGHLGGPAMIDFFPDSQRLIAGGQECTFKIYDVITGNLLQTIPANGPIAFRTFRGKLSPDGTKLAGCVGDSTTVWDTSTWLPIWTRYGTGADIGLPPMWSSDSSLVGDSHSVYNAATGVVDWLPAPYWNPGYTFSDMSLDGQSVISSYSFFTKTGGYRDMSNTGLENPIFAPTYTTLSGGNLAGTGHSIDPGGNGYLRYVYTSLGSFESGLVKHVRLAWSQTAKGNRYLFGATVAFIGNDAWLQMFDTQTHTTTNLAHFGPGTITPNYATTGLAVSTDGNLAAIARGLTIALTEDPIIVATVPFIDEEGHFHPGGVQVGDFRAHNYYVNGVAYSGQPLSIGGGQSAHIVASVAGDRTARIWNAATGAPLSMVILPIPTGGSSRGSIALSPDGRTMAVSLGDKLSIYDTTDPRAPILIQTHNDKAYPPVFSPDGKYLAYAA